MRAKYLCLWCLICSGFLSFVFTQIAIAEKKDDSHFYVAYKKVTVKSEATADSFPVALVYPSKTPSKDVKFGPFTMQLSIGAKIAEGKFPLVIISHGSGGTNLGHRSIAFELVNNGYVVGMPLHPRNNFKNNIDEGTLENWINRPIHINESIEAIISDSTVSKNIDASKIAIVGHSAGGYTTMSTAGGVADTQTIIDYCQSNKKGRDVFCDMGKGNPSKATGVKISNPIDVRIKAIVMMAPVGILFNAKDSLKKVNIPTLLLNAEKDELLIEPYHSETIANNFINKDLISYCTIPNAGHYSFITPFPQAIRSRLGEVAADPEGFHREAFHQLLSKDIVQFIDTALNANPFKKTPPLSCSIN